MNSNVGGGRPRENNFPFMAVGWAQGRGQLLCSGPVAAVDVGVQRLLCSKGPGEHINRGAPHF